MITPKNKMPLRATSPRVNPIIKYTILTVIVLAIITVISSLIFTILSDPERVVKQRITDIASDYYENYLYKKALTSAGTQSTTELAEHYTRTGFPPITLRQLFLFDNERYSESSSTIVNYCNENNTFITFYPESPFTSTDYRVEYHYACTF